MSRLFAKEGARLLGEFRTRDIKRDNWLILMVDGVALDRELVGLVERCTQHITESTRTLVELRREIRDMRYVDAKVVREDERKSDTDMWPTSTKR